MQPEIVPNVAIPADLHARLEATAAAQQRSAAEVLRAAIEHYLATWRAQAPLNQRSPAEAAARMRRSRPGNILPEGTTLRNLLTHGRA